LGNFPTYAEEGRNAYRLLASLFRFKVEDFAEGNLILALSGLILVLNAFSFNNKLYNEMLQIKSY
jgi:hypothetical protein